MKFKTAILFAATLGCAGIKSQDDQTAKALKMGDGTFMRYVINQNGADYSYAGIHKEPWSLAFKPFHDNYKELSVKRDGSSSEESYYPDEEAFPATYIYGRLDDAKQMAGYEYIDYNDEKRVVILDEWVYFLEKWKSKDNYVITACIKKGELSGFKLTRAAFGAAKEMEKANHKSTLQNYLDEAFKKQAELLPEWQNKNKDKIEKKQVAKERHRFVIDSINGRYWNSAEGRRKKAEWAQAPIVIFNDTNTEFLMCHGQGVSTFLKPGEKKEFACTGSGRVFKGERIPNNTSNLKNTGILLIEFNGKNCGATINASTLRK